MFDTTLVDQKLPGYAYPLTVIVAVQSLLITAVGMKAQWSISLPEEGAKLPGTPPPAPLFSGFFDLPVPPTLMDGLGQYFQAISPGLVAGLKTKAEAAAAPEPNQELP